MIFRDFESMFLVRCITKLQQNYSKADDKQSVNIVFCDSKEHFSSKKRKYKVESEFFRANHQKKKASFSPLADDVVGFCVM